MIVVDAAAVGDMLYDEGARGAWAARELAEADGVHAPDLIDYEMVSFVRHRALQREISSTRGQEMLVDFTHLSIRRHRAQPLLLRMWELRQGLTAYDAAYVALAEALDAPLVTTDDRLARSRGHRAEIRAPA